MDIGAWMDGFEVASAPARAVRDAESVVLMARHEQLRARVDDPAFEERRNETSAKP